MNERDVGFLLVFIVIAIFLTLLLAGGCVRGDNISETRKYMIEMSSDISDINKYMKSHSHPDKD